MAQQAVVFDVTPDFSIGVRAVIRQAAVMYDFTPTVGNPWIVPCVQLGVSRQPAEVLSGGRIQVLVEYDATTSVELANILRPFTAASDSNPWYVIGRDAVAVLGATPAADLDVTSHKVDIPTPSGGMPTDADAVIINWAS